MWDLLTKPAAAVTDSEERQKARLLASMLLVAALIYASAVFLVLPFLADLAGYDIRSQPVYFINIVCMLGLLITYGLARSKYMKASRNVALALLTAALYANILYKLEFLRYETIIIYIVVLYTLASFYLTIRQMSWLALIYLAFTSLIVLLSPEVTYMDFLTPMPVIVMMLVLPLLFMRYRDSQEQARQAELSAALHKTELLNETSQFISSTLEFEDVLTRIAEQMCRAVDATSAYICDFDDVLLTSTVLAEYAGSAASEAERVSDMGATYEESTILEAEFLLIMREGQHDYSHIDSASISEVERQHMQQYGAKTVLYIPLRVQGQLIGYTELWESRYRREYSADELSLCHSIAQQAAFALENAQLHRQLKDHAADLEKRVAERTAALETTNMQLQHASEAKDEFVSNVSHELKTPLTNIKLYLNLLRLRPNNGPRYMSVMDQEVGRLEGIVESLLYLTELDTEKVAVKFTECDLNPLVEAFVADRTALADRRGLSLTSELAAALPPVSADAVDVEKALSNLLSNAINYTPSGGQIVVSTKERCDEQEVHWVGVSVADSGPGFEPDEMPRLFERFFRGKQALNTGTSGAGLGLFIVKDIVERHGGEIEVSQNGGGSGAHLTLWLPSAKDRQTS